jgi:hypothetical protein
MRRSWRIPQVPPPAADDREDERRRHPHPLPDDAPVAIARQAIHDRWTKVVGYALLLRDRCGRLLADDEEHAATQVIVETFTGIGVTAVVGDLPAHVRVPRRCLLELHPLALPPERVVPPASRSSRACSRRCR